MSDSNLQALCRAALLRACYWMQDAPSEGGPGPETPKPRTVFVDVNDAAACMAFHGARC